MLSHSRGKFKSKGNWILNAVGFSSKDQPPWLAHWGQVLQILLTTSMKCLVSTSVAPAAAERFVHSVLLGECRWVCKLTFFISPCSHFKMIFQMLANEALLNYWWRRSIYLLAFGCIEQEVCAASRVLNETRQQRTERISLRTGGLRMAKTQGSIIELMDKNLRAWRSHLFFREEVWSIYAKICKKQRGKMILVLYCIHRQA